MSLITVTHLHRQALDRVARINLVQDTTYNHEGTTYPHIIDELALAQLILVFDDRTSCLTGLGAQTLKRWYTEGHMSGISNEPEGYTLYQLDQYATEWRSLKAQVSQHYKAVTQDADI